jgi:alpha-beta hydrolase superfamily lysophospholipase
VIILRTMRRLLVIVISALVLAGCSSNGSSPPAAGPTGATGATSSSTPSTSSTLPTPTTLPAGQWSSSTTPTVTSFYDPPNPLPPEPPGTLIRAEEITGVPNVPSGAEFWRILYHSRTATGADVAVSGYVIVPGGKVPAGGHPVIAWAHGTTGTARTCAPSLVPGPSDGAGLYLTPDLDALLSAGYEITATDYQGLGAPGVTPYLVGNAEGEDVLDAARAASQLPGADLSHDVVIVGHSEGGQAALFAGQLAPSYAPSLDVVGTVAIAPLTETEVALPLAEQFGETPLIALAAYAWSHTYPDLPMSTVFTAQAIPVVDHLASTLCESAFAQALARQSSVSAHLFQPNFTSNPVLKRYLAANSPGASKTASPILVLQGTADTTIPDLLAQGFEKTQCPAVHDTLALRLYPGATHTTILSASAADMLAWISQRFQGKPVPAGCSVSNA